MFRETAYAGAMTVASAVSSVMASPHIGNMTGPLIWDAGGIPVPIVPSLIGVLAALLVRIIVVTRSIKRRNLRIYNVSITLLTMLATAVYISDRQLGPGASFLAGVGCGAAGVGIIELSRSPFFSAMRVGMQAAFQTMFKGPPPPPA